MNNFRLVVTVAFFISAHSGAAYQSAPAQYPPISRFISQEDLNGWAQKAAAESLGDSAKFMSVFDEQVRGAVPWYAKDPVRKHVAVPGSDPEVFLAGPLFNYSVIARESARRLEPIPSTLDLESEFQLHVQPKTINALDIERVVLQRDGQLISARGALEAVSLSTALGLRRVIRAGAVFFHMSALRPGASSLRLVLIPASGSNIVYTLTAEDVKVLTAGFVLEQ